MAYTSACTVFSYCYTNNRAANNRWSLDNGRPKLGTVLLLQYLTTSFTNKVGLSYMLVFQLCPCVAKIQDSKLRLILVQPLQAVPNGDYISMC